VTKFNPEKAKWKAKAYIRNSVLLFRVVVWSMPRAANGGQGAAAASAGGEGERFAVEFQRRQGCAWGFGDIYRAAKRHLVALGVVVDVHGNKVSPPVVGSEAYRRDKQCRRRGPFPRALPVPASAAAAAERKPKLPSMANNIKPLIGMVSSQYWEVQREGLVRFACLAERLPMSARAQLASVPALMTKIVEDLNPYVPDHNDDMAGEEDDDSMFAASAPRTIAADADAGEDDGEEVEREELPANVHFGGECDPGMELHRCAATFVAHLTRPPTTQATLQEQELWEGCIVNLVCTSGAIKALARLAAQRVGDVDAECRRQATRALANMCTTSLGCSTIKSVVKSQQGLKAIKAASLDDMYPRLQSLAKVVVVALNKN
jgi:hypothetical protein